MSDGPRRVVVTVEEELSRHEASGTVAARYDALGLTAYGTTEDEASAELRRLFGRDVDYYRGKGLLERRLNLLGVEWCWADEYPADGPPYEDAGSAAAPASPPLRPGGVGGDRPVPTQALRLAA